MVNLGTTPPRRVREALERVRPGRQGQDQTPGRRHVAQKNLATSGLRETLSTSRRVQSELLVGGSYTQRLGNLVGLIHSRYL